MHTKRQQHREKISCRNAETEGLSEMEMCYLKERIHQAMRNRDQVAWPNYVMRETVAKYFGRAGFSHVILTYPMAQVGPSQLEILAIKASSNTVVPYRAKGNLKSDWVATISPGDAWVLGVPVRIVCPSAISSKYEHEKTKSGRKRYARAH